MGAWGYEALANDTGVDWCYELEKSSDGKVIELALDAVEELGDGYIDDRTGCNALAACEAIARLQGRPGYKNSYTECIDNWTRRADFTVTPALLRKANHAIDLILGDNSELRAQWEDNPKWSASVCELRSRMGIDGIVS